MRIHFRESRGIVASFKACVVDTQDPALGAEGAKLERLVEMSGIEREVTQDAAPGRDLAAIEITIEREGGSKTVQLDQVGVKPALLPLIESLRKRAKPAPPR